MRLVFFFFILLFSTNLYGAEKIKYRSESYNEVWNDLVGKYHKFLDGRNNWNYCYKSTPLTREGRFRRVAVCYAEEEINRLEKYNLLVSQKILDVVKSSMNKIWDSSDAVDGAIIFQSGDEYSEHVMQIMIDNINYYQRNKLPEVLIEVFNELNDQANYTRIQNEKRITEEKKITEEKANKPKSKSILKKILGID